MKYIALAFLLIAFSGNPLFGQLEKGDLLVDFNAAINIGKVNIQSSDIPKFRYSSNFNPKVGYMVNDHFMAGTGIDIFYSKGYSTISGLSISKTLGIAPFFRYYYFSKNKLMPYVYFNSSFQRVSRDYEYEDEYLQSFKHWKASATGGLGLNLFIANNILLEVHLGTALFDNKNVNIWNDLLVYGMGIRTVINNWADSSGDDLMEKYMQRGNFKVGGNTRFSLSHNYQFEEDGNVPILAAPLEKEINIEPLIKYFTKDNLAVLLNPAFNLRRNGNAKIQSVQLGAGIEQYSPIAERLFLVPTFQLSAKRQWYKQYFANTVFTTGVPTLDTMEFKNSNTFLTAGFSATLKYFTKNKIIYNSGFELIFTNIYNHDFRGRKYVSGEQNIFLGLDYFFAPNLIVGFNVRHNKLRSRINSDQIAQLPYGIKNGKLLLSFSLDYFIFRN